ncbi:MAG TPA: hypothetical protein VFT22_02195 [Kofleriaceae bacterium]|nr:hypothetical protein [Kofleriaceae bacterium]
MKARAAVALVMAMTGTAAAEGERTPMLGGALTYTDVPDHRDALVGGELDLTWWWGRLGLGVEAAARRGIEDEDLRNLAVTGSARVLMTDWLWPSLFEPRDVEMGVELQLIGEHTWWSRDDASDAFGLGLAVRMRGGSDWEFSSLLAESRLFVRVMKARDETSEVLARTTDPAVGRQDQRGIAVTVGLGAAFGSGTPRYVERFRLRTFDVPRR